MWPFTSSLRANKKCFNRHKRLWSLEIFESFFSSTTCLNVRTSPHTRVRSQVSPLFSSQISEFWHKAPMLIGHEGYEDLREINESHEEGEGDHKQKENFLISPELPNMRQQIIEIDDPLLRCLGAWLGFNVASYFQLRDHSLFIVDVSFVDVCGAGFA